MKRAQQERKVVVGVPPLTAKQKRRAGALYRQGLIDRSTFEAVTAGPTRAALRSSGGAKR